MISTTSSPLVNTERQDSRKFLIHCPGYKIPLRIEPNPSAKARKYLHSGTVVEVFSTAKSAGYYELTDHSVRLTTRFIE